MRTVAASASGTRATMNAGGRGLEPGAAGGVPEPGPHLAGDPRFAIELRQPVSHHVHHRDVGEVGDQAVWRWVREDPRYVAHGVEQDLSHMPGRVAVMHAQSQRDAMRARRPRQVAHLAGDELAVGKEERVPILGDETGRAPADLHDATAVATGLDPVALTEGAVELQRQATEQVGDGRLEREADDRRQHRRGGE